jgi:DGQHR domain-containing protein
MTDTEPISFACMELTQPIGKFYIGVMDARDLVEISYADIRRLEMRDVEEYLGIQRTLSNSRVKELTQYVHTVDATFPTSVILAVSSEHVQYSEELHRMVLPRFDSVAKIIDGQHRIAGLKNYRGSDPFMMNVTIFVDMDIEDQALVFSTINLSQTKVSKSLVYDLYAFAKSRSPQKTSHNIVRLLNKQAGSPFNGKIKVLGVATAGERGETLTQAAFVSRLLPYITDDAMRDRDLLKRGEELPDIPTDRREDLIFGQMFIEERDEDIALVLYNYFGAIKRRWTTAWSNSAPGNILNRTTGFAGFMRFLGVAYEMYKIPGTVPPVEFFDKVFASSTIKESDFTPASFPPGGTGESRLANRLSEEARAIRD